MVNLTEKSVRCMQKCCYYPFSSGSMMDFLSRHQQYYADVLLDPHLCEDIPACGLVVRKVRELRQAQARSETDRNRYSQRTVAEKTYAIGETKIGYDRTSYAGFEDGKIPMGRRLSAPFLEILLEYLKCSHPEKREIWRAWACGWLRAMAGQ